MVGSPMVDDRLEAARDAVRRFAWREAYDLLFALDAEGGLPSDDLASLAESAWWTGGHAKAIDANERAYAAYVEAGDTRRAAMIAMALVANNNERRAGSLAAGWLKRAMRLLENEPDSVEQGYVERILASRALDRGQLDEAVERSSKALEIGMRFGDRDLQATALDVRGWTLVLQGKVDEGMALLEEATAAAVGGELGPRATGVVYCNMIGICHDLGDFRRAGEWTEAAKRWCERQAISGFPGQCRVYRAEVMRLRGAWTEAESEARRATEELKEFNLTVAGRAFYEIGEIRLRMGDLDEAEEAFRQAHELGFQPEPGRSLLLLRRGDVAAAAASIPRALEEEWDPLVRVPLLAAQAAIGTAAGDLDSARKAADELETSASSFGTESLQAAAASARGAVALAEGEAETAVRSLRRAWQIWQSVDLPYEAAQTRALLASAYRQEGDETAALLELEAARLAFERLGAALDAVRCADLLASWRDRGAERRTVQTFMFTDIVGSTALLEAIGDQAWGGLRRWHDESLRSCFRQHAGEEIDHAGDGFFVAFPAAEAALSCAADIQRRLAEHRQEHGFAPQVRIGVHAAEATRSGDGFAGKGVHTAARIGGLAQGGEILASRTTIEAAGSGLETSEVRQVTLKGVAEPVEIVSIDWR
ncbi:MAG: adenylate/guanylate cyclase domain-containing protein [Actinomycetota bacterium]